MNEKFTLSKGALEILSDNGYRLKYKKDQFLLINSGCVRNAIAIFAIVPIIFATILTAINPYVGIPSLAFILFIAIRQFRNNPGKSRLLIDTKSCFIEFNSNQFNIDAIKSISITSELVDQYANAHIRNQ